MISNSSRNRLKAKCTSNSPSELPEVYFDAGYTKESAIDLEVGRCYQVHGMCLRNGALLFLVIDETDSPDWYPAPLFGVIGGELPSTWCFNWNPLNEGVNAVWGYPELALNEEHFDELSEREEHALKIFWERVLPQK